MPPLLQLKNLHISYPQGDDRVLALAGVDLELAAGATLGLVGESGCGKSSIASVVCGLLPPEAEVSADCCRFAGHDLTALSEAAWRQLRGKRIALVPQDPLAALTPQRRLASQLREVYRQHHPHATRHTVDTAIKTLWQAVELAPELMLRYPHQCSGGQRQRAVIAMALAGEPDLLIADEATTALDVLVQRHILDLLSRLVRERDMALLFISHDLGVVHGCCDEVAVCYAGRVVEHGPCQEVLRAPRHPYTQALAAALPESAASSPDAQLSQLSKSKLNETPTKGRLLAIPGQAPRLDQPWRGCAFAPRCRFANDSCRTNLVETVDDQRRWSCHHPVNLSSASLPASQPESPSESLANASLSSP